MQPLTKTLTAVFFLLALHVPIHAADQPNSSQNIYNQAVEAYRACDYNASIAYMSQIYDKVKQSQDANTIIGDSYRHLNEPNLAIEYFFRAYNLGARNHTALTGLGYCLMDVGAYQDAYGVLNETIGHFPNDADAYWNLGLTCEQLGDYDCLLGTMQKTISLAPHLSPEPYLKAGYVLTEKGDLRGSLESYLAGLQYFDSDPLLLYHAGDLFFYDGNYEGAIPYLSKAVDVVPDYIDAWYLLGMSFYNLEDLDNAAKACEIMSDIDSQAETTQNLCNQVETKIMQRKMEEMQRLVEQQQIQQQIDDDIRQQNENEQMIRDTQMFGQTMF